MPDPSRQHRLAAQTLQRTSLSRLLYMFSVGNVVEPNIEWHATNLPAIPSPTAAQRRC